MINLLIVDDSETELAILKAIFSKEPDFKIVGCARNGKEAIELTKRLNPTVITMDIQMPIMDGVEAIKHIIAQYPIPIVVISSTIKKEELNMSFRALEAGALSVLDKPDNISSPTFEKMRKRMVDTVRAMSEIRVIRRKFTDVKSVTSFTKNETQVLRSYELIAIGTSVGGPQALRVILKALPQDLPIPIVIVQHMTPGFMKGFTTWLNENIALAVKEAENLEILKPGVIYFAPDHHHLVVNKSSQGLMAKLITTPAVSGFRPSATVLFESVASACGKHAIGVLLTGMGNDGAAGLLEMKKKGAHTIIQDEDSAVVFGMAGVALKIGAADKMVELDSIAEYLINSVKNTKPSSN